ncbi:MAG: nucleoside 2-deoxyribosyltransferase [Armatimonadota bacterium]|nr:nucleoside 2-deoxyribosyltransferase [Armatimonadota bacterium]MDR5696958.1 nucleoside 2-deoxyribosyltransferase [Armatimonadota bacterium]
MRVYFCGAIRGGRRLQPRYARIVSWLQQRGHQVLTAHVGRADVLEHERATRKNDRAIYEGDMAWIEQADVVIAEVTVPSIGVGMEIMRAQMLGKRVVCLCEAGADVSALVAGNPHVELWRYRDEDELLRILDRLVSSAGG